MNERAPDTGRDVGDPLDLHLRRAFDALARAQVPYVVLRGFLPVEELARTVDVDLYVPRRARTQAAAALAAAGWLERRHQVGRHPHRFFDCWTGGPGLVRSLDVVTDLVFGAALHRLQNADRALEDAELLAGVRVPAPDSALFLFALHVVLDKGVVSPANRARGEALVERYRASTRAPTALGFRFGGDAAAFVERFAASLGVPQEDAIAGLSEQARGLRVLRSQRALALTDRLKRRLVQLRRPVVRIAVLGIDGSGKSTLIERATHAPSTLRAWSGYLGGNQFRTLPTRWLQSRLRAYDERRDQRGLAYRIVANLNTLWWPVELLVRMMIAEHRSELVLYDRFPLGQDDVRPTSLWGRVIGAYGRVARALRPGADLVVLLDGDDRVIWERKREFPFEVHQRTQQRYRELVAGLRGETAVVRTDRSPEESFGDLKRALAASATIRRKLYGA